MNYSPLSMARRHVLGALYSRCEQIAGEVPVFVTPTPEEETLEPSLVGHVDQGLGHYADAFTFHLSPDLCKQLSAGYFSYEFNYEYVDPKDKGSQSKVRLSSISLVARTNYTRPIPRRHRAAS